jgi:hypothetical protein
MQKPHESDDGSRQRGGIKFDATINLGHMLTFAGFLITMMVTWTTLDKRVVVLEESKKAQDMRDSTQDQRNSDQMSTIKESLAEIKATVIGLRERLDRKP